MHEVYHIFVHSSPGNGRCHFWILAAAFRRRCRTTSFKTQLVAVQILIPSKTVASMNQRASLCMSWLPGKPANPPIRGVLFTRATPSSHPYFNSIIHVPWFVYHPFGAWGNPLDDMETPHDGPRRSIVWLRSVLRSRPGRGPWRPLGWWFAAVRGVGIMITTLWLWLTVRHGIDCP